MNDKYKSFIKRLAIVRTVESVLFTFYVIGSCIILFDDDFLKYNTSFANGIYFILCSPFLLYVEYLLIKKSAILSLDCIGGFKNKNIIIFVKKIWNPTAFSCVDGIRYYELIAIFPDNKKRRCILNYKLHNKKIEKSRYYLATLSRYSNTIIDLIPVKKINGEWIEVDTDAGRDSFLCDQ